MIVIIKDPDVPVLPHPPDGEANAEASQEGWEKEMRRRKSAKYSSTRSPVVTRFLGTKTQNRFSALSSGNGVEGEPQSSPGP